MNALILVDIQHDFLPGGALAVPEGNAVISVANRMMQNFDLVVATQDWHPPDHVSFVDNHPGHQLGDVVEVDGLEQILWPVHCVPGTWGVELSSDLKLDEIDYHIHKGATARIDSYSTYFDNAHAHSTGLHDYLTVHNVTDVYLMGLATDYCVKYSVLDALNLGYVTYVITDGCRGIDLQPGDVMRAFTEMRLAGAKLISSEDVMAKFNGISTTLSDRT